MAVFGQKIELEEFPVTIEDLAHVPDDTFVHHRHARAEPVRNIECSLGKTDCFGSKPRPFMIVEHENWCAALTQIECKSQTNRSPTDHHDRVALDGTLLILRS